MRITIDVSPAVHHHAGLGRYAAELLTALLTCDHNNEYCAFYHTPHGDEKLEGALRSVPTYSIRLGAKPWRMSVLLAYYANRTMDRWLPPSDVFHGTDHLLPPLGRSRMIFTIHDLIYLFFPEYHLPLNRWFLTLMLPKFLRRADAIIAVSENTRRDVTRRLGIPAEKMTVIYEGVSERFRSIQDRAELERVRARYELPPRMILFFGTLEPRKNLLTLLDAFAALLATRPDVPPLVIAGRKGWLYRPIFRRVRERGLESHVRFTDWIAEDDVPTLLNLAEVFVYPSLYEGFGLPPLEAMACGVPVICSNAASLPEVVGDAGILVEPRDVGGLMQALARVLDDASLRADLRARGVQRAQQFTWERAARQTLAVYEQSAVGGGRRSDLA